MSNKAILCLLVLPIAISCQKDSAPGAGGGDKSIVCDVSIMGAYDTKSAEVDLKSLRKDGQTFRMDAWLEAENRGAAWPEFNDDPHYIKNATMSYLSSYGEHGGWTSSDMNVVWTNQIWTNFWAQYPHTLTGRDTLAWTAAGSGSITDNEERTPSFTYDMSAYTVPFPNMNNDSWEAADVTPDFLVAYARQRYELAEGDAPNKLFFKFAHALSAVKFSPKGILQGNPIDSILVSGICSRGTCHLTGLPAYTESNTVDSVKFSWSGNETLSHDRGFGTVVDTTKTYIFLIPQQLNSTAVLKIHLTTTSGGNPDFEKWYEASLEGVTWKPGYIYDYFLDFDPYKHAITVTVDEDGYDIEPGLWNEE